MRHHLVATYQTLPGNPWLGRVEERPAPHRFQGTLTLPPATGAAAGGPA